MQSASERDSRPDCPSAALAETLGSIAFWLYADKTRLTVVGPEINANRDGRPHGCTGSRQAATLFSEFKRQGGGIGMITMCIGGGMGAAGLFEV